MLVSGDFSQLQILDYNKMWMWGIVAVVNMSVLKPKIRAVKSLYQAWVFNPA